MSVSIESSSSNRVVMNSSRQTLIGGQIDPVFQTVGSGDLVGAYSVRKLSIPSASQVQSPFATGGNSVYTLADGSYVHVFTSSGTFQVSRNIVGAQVLVVAGGGSGGSGGTGNGGGGAGGVLFQEGQSIPLGVHTVTIGNGGARSIGLGNDGENSSFGSRVAFGGGGGGTHKADTNSAGRNGGSGGGAGTDFSVRPGGTGITGQGNAGGSSAGLTGAGGGGGAGELGTNGTSTPTNGRGGNGRFFSQFSKITGSPLGWFGGGGGGGGEGGSGAGGTGGGGAGAINNATPGSSAIANTGGGGGGCRSGSTGELSGAGGSGIVIIRYFVPNTPYRGPTLRIRRDTDNALADVWTDSQGGVAKVSEVTTTGGDVILDWSRIHVFRTVGNSTFTVNAPEMVDVLVVAGGGAGGWDTGGGGGGGGIVYAPSLNISVSNISVTVGGGGTITNNTTRGGNGGNSIFQNLTAIGGGGGGTAHVIGGGDGGSGGGGASTRPTPGSGTTSQGFSGGTAANVNTSGGGGGAAEPGKNSVGTICGNGGNGRLFSITGTSSYYGGGGGGGTYLDNHIAGLGGIGGGGTGGTGNTIQSTPGTPNTGGGGGGGGYSSIILPSNGGSGIVIVRVHPTFIGREALSSWLGTSTGTVVTWYDQSGSGNHATTIRGNPRVTLFGTQNYLYGTTADGIRFPSAILPSTYTLFHVARYADSGSRGRIFDGVSTDGWASGFHVDKSGVAGHNEWITQSSTDTHGRNLIVSVDQNQPNLYRSNGVNRTIVSTSSASDQLSINHGNRVASEASDWIVHEVLVYNTTLSLQRILETERALMQRYLGSTDEISLTARTGARGLYALRELSGTWNGPTLTVTRSTDGQRADLYFDANGKFRSFTVQEGILNFKYGNNDSSGGIFANLTNTNGLGTVQVTNAGANQTEYQWTLPFNQGQRVADVLVVAGGGGGGGWYHAGGGGAGGLLFVFNYSLSNTINISVGKGGNGGADLGRRGGQNGTNSSFHNLVAIGGGGGGSEGFSGNDGPFIGGSGGGGAWANVNAVPSTNRNGANGTSGQGNRGGDGSYDFNVRIGGGGGGFSQPGGNANVLGVGGDGFDSSFIFGTSVGQLGWFSGGGGGVGSAGGKGGGGAGDQSASSHTGGGGGGRNGPGGTGGNGGSGSVLICLKRKHNGISEFLNWLNGAVPLVETWYDQSGNNNHATQALFGRRWPPGNLTTPTSYTPDIVNVTGEPYGNGTYEFNGRGWFANLNGNSFGHWRAFDNNISTGYNGYGNHVDSNTGIPIYTYWLTIKLPESIRLSRYTLYGNTGGPYIASWRFYGSVNNTLVLLDQKTDITNWGANEIRSFYINPTASYDFYRIDIDKLNIGSTQVNIRDIALYDDNYSYYRPILKFVDSMPVLDFRTSRFFVLPDGTVPTGNSAYSFVVQHGEIDVSVSPSTILSSGRAGTAANITNSLWVFNTGAAIRYNNWWWSNDLVYGTYSNNAVTSVTYNGTTHIGYVNGIQTDSRTPSTARNGEAIHNYIGARSDFISYFNSDLYYVGIFGTALTQAEIQSLGVQAQPRQFGAIDNIGATPIAAYGIRLLINSYTGPLVRVRRSTDNAEADVFFNYIGVVTRVSRTDNTSTFYGRNALSTFQGAATLFVTTWYDQSGNGRNATQTTTSIQPKLIQLYDRYIVYFDPSTNDVLSFANTDVLTLWSQFFVNSLTNGYATLIGRGGSDVSVRFESRNVAVNNGDLFWTSDNSAFWYVNNVFGNTLSAEPRIALGSWQTLYAIRPNSFSGFNMNEIGRTNQGLGLNRDFNGTISEIIMFSTALSSSLSSQFYNARYMRIQGALDGITSTPSAAYSLRLLYGNYTGPIVRVRRSTDNVEADIYFDYRGTVVFIISSGIATYGSTALSTFQGAATLFVTTWYDQSGNGRNATQTTTSIQPTLVNLRINFNSSSNQWLITNTFTTQMPFTNILQFNPLRSSADQFAHPWSVASRPSSTNDVTMYIHHVPGDTNTNTLYNHAIGYFNLTMGVSRTITTVLNNGTSASFYKDSILNTLTNFTSAYRELNGITIGGDAGGGRAYYHGNMSSLIFLNGTISENQIDTIHNILQAI